MLYTIYFKWFDSFNKRYYNYIDFLANKYIYAETITDAFYYYFAVCQWTIETQLLKAFQAIKRRSERKQFNSCTRYIIEYIAKNAMYKDRKQYDLIFEYLESMKSLLQTKEDANKLLFIADYANKLYFN